MAETPPPGASPIPDPESKVPEKGPVVRAPLVAGVMFALIASALLHRVLPFAPAILFSDRAFQDSATRVFMDMPLMFLTQTEIGLTLRWIRRGGGSALTGALVFVGLGCATKFSAGSLAAAGTPKGVVLMAAVLAVGAWRTARRLRAARRFEAPEYLGVLFLATLAATVAWLPFDWPRFYLSVFSLSAVFAAWGAMEMEENLSRCAEPDAGGGETRQG